MRWRFPAVDDAPPRPHPCRCGGKPVALYAPTSVISCENCGEKITISTPPLFGNSASQREHETWRAVSAWNERRDPKVIN